ncbi:small heat shock protein p36-like [Littorina saxatilis]|uniref:SHSP domain-containing protein n=1 Tax=Littorina saxatilis TaxID=31220 RepID=A0AAN9B3S5_9CAEN
MAMYRSEVHIPVQKDSLNFQDRAIKQWSNVDTHADERRKQWQDEFDRMRQEFFVLKPADRKQSVQFVNMDMLKTALETDSDGRHMFRVRFDVSEFKPEEVNVKVQDNKLCVNARHEEKTAQTSVSREYSRQVDIPSGVDQDALNCLLSKDGVLTVESPVNQPALLSRETYLPVKASPLNASPSRNLGVGTPVKNPIVTDADGTRRMRLNVDIGEFSPDEIVVKTTDRKLIVHAEHEERTAGRTLHKEFNKEYDLPESVDSSNISAYLSDDKQLTIEAPLKATAATVQRKTYQVTQSQDVQRVVVNKEGSVTISDARNRPMVTISVHRK